MRIFNIFIVFWRKTSSSLTFAEARVSLGNGFWMDAPSLESKPKPRKPLKCLWMAKNWSDSLQGWGQLIRNETTHLANWSRRYRDGSWFHFVPSSKHCCCCCCCRRLHRCREKKPKPTEYIERMSYKHLLPGNSFRGY